MPAEATVFLIDDDVESRRSVQRLIGEAGLRVETFATAEEFLEKSAPDPPGCVLVDLRVPEMGGLELLGRLRRRRWSAPVIILSGYGDVRAAVRALEAGAAAFVEKPFEPKDLLEKVRCTLDRDAKIRRDRLERTDVESRLARLTRREREVLDLIVTGATTKLMARQLSVSRKTIEIHRSRVMKKMEAGSVAELATLAAKFGFAGDDPELRGDGASDGEESAG